MTKKQKKIDVSQFKLILAIYLKMNNSKGSFWPLLPVNVFKHSIQAKYNEGKKGIDQNTQISQKVSFKGMK